MITERMSLMLEEAPNDVWPVCPHCKQELTRIWTITGGLGMSEQERVLICPHCRAVLAHDIL